MKGVGVALCLLTVACCCLEPSVACRTSAECHHEECCVSASRPIGKRQLIHTHDAGKRQLVHTHDAGTCQPRANLSGGCLMRDAVYDSSRIYFQCPCVDGLTCKGNGRMDIPLGKMGTCVSV